MPKLITLAEDVFIVDHFLSEEDCQFWINHCEDAGFEDAAINVGGRQVINKSIRNNERFILDDADFAASLWEKSKPYVVMKDGPTTAVGLNERFRFYKYKPGHRFRAHHDGPYIRTPDEYSKFTYMIYLNEGMGGGDTRFLDADVSLTPKTGTLLIFRHNLYHEGAEVTAGMKYVLRSDVMYHRNR
jgi:hypothetical protein